MPRVLSGLPASRNHIPGMMSGASGSKSSIPGMTSGSSAARKYLPGMTSGRDLPPIIDMYAWRDLETMHFQNVHAW